jgi:threonine/homoserine/homoserine lactone efflux protein
MFTALMSGCLLGLAAGLAPGPLLALTLSHSLQHGPLEGCKIALSPLLTDAPVILLAVFLASRAADVQPLLGLLSLAGGLFVGYLAWATLRTSPSPLQSDSESPRSWFKGVATNLLSPHPWLFWMTVGTSSLARALEHGWLTAAAFLCAFYLLLIGCKLSLALLAGRSRRWLSGPAYRWVLRTLAVFLMLFAAFLLRESWHRFLAS